MTCTCGNCQSCNADWLSRAPVGNVKFATCQMMPTTYISTQLRDEIAIAALQGIIMKHGTYDEQQASKSAYAFADAMLAQRDAA